MADEEEDVEDRYYSEVVDGDLVKWDAYTEEVVAINGLTVGQGEIPSEVLRKAQELRRRYSEEIGTAICMEIIEGASIKKACLGKGMPSYRQVQHWRLRNELFNQMVRSAIRLRAEALRDDIQHVADTAKSTKDPINEARLKVEAYKWLAEKDDPITYGRREEGTDTSVTVIIDTGIDRGKPVVEVKDDE